MNESEKPRILIAEDDNDLRELLAFVFSTDYDVTDVPTGDEALELLSKDDSKFDVLLTDIQMPPGISGTDLVKLISSEVRSSLMIVFLTGQGLDEVIVLRDDKILNEINFFQKPILVQDVKTAIDRGLTVRI